VATRLGGAVLIAEDVPATRDLLAGFLREAGCAPIAEVGSGPELLDAWRAARFDLMLVDWQMPELDGLSALALIRAEERERGFERTPVVVVTASAMPGDRERCLDAGADAVIEKPIDLERLAQVLARWLTPAPAPAVVPWPGAAQAGGGRAVLVAEDHAGNRELVRSLLAEEGFARVDAVGTGLEAVAAWQQGGDDVMLLDWHMPGIDGLEALRRIRAGERELGRPRAALVMVTGRLSDADRAACFAAGADECVAKPHTPDELLAGIARALQAVGR
jgi:CheY-like chemotaxis protein